MTRTIRWKYTLVALPLLAGIVLAAPAAEARVGIGLSVPLIVPPPVVVGPPLYYALPPSYYYAPPPPYGYFWYDRFGRHHWAH